MLAPSSFVFSAMARDEHLPIYKAALNVATASRNWWPKRRWIWGACANAACAGSLSPPCSNDPAVEARTNSER